MPELYASDRGQALAFVRMTSPTPRRGADRLIDRLYGGLVPGREPARASLLHRQRPPSRNGWVLETWRVEVGAPVWVGRLPGPMRSWVRQHPLNGARVAFFCTEGRTGDARLFAQLRSLCKQRPLATMAVTEAQLDADLDPMLARFATALAQAL